SIIAVEAVLRVRITHDLGRYRRGFKGNAQPLDLLDRYALIAIAEQPQPRRLDRRAQCVERRVAETPLCEASAVERDGGAEGLVGGGGERDAATHAETDDPGLLDGDAALLELREGGVDVAREPFGRERSHHRHETLEVVVFEDR